MSKFGDVYCVKDETNTAFIEFQKQGEHFDKVAVCNQIRHEALVIDVYSYRESLTVRNAI